MILIRTNRTLLSRGFSRTSCFSSIAHQEDNEYTATPQYPPILDLSFEKRLERKKEAVHEEIKAVKTVEEKQIKLNMPRYYGFKSYMVLEDNIPYNSLALTQHITRTHLIKNKDLPECYKSIEAQNVEKLAKGVQEALLMEIDGIQRLHDFKNEDLTDVEKENIVGSNIIKQINRVLNNDLAHKYPHIINTEIDIGPRIESCWYVGGMDPPDQIKRCRKGLEYLKKYENEPVDRLMYYIGSPSMTLRAELPLPLVVSPSEAENSDMEIPYFQYDPRVLGLKTEHRHMANIPGFWPNDSNNFGLLSFHNRGYMSERSKYIQDSEDNQEALHCQGILASYAWLHSQANYLGFTTFNDITYPLVTQTVITNGKNWNFYIYQLNTIVLHSKYIKENPKRNICWASEDVRLYDEIKDGKIVGFNDETLKILVKLYTNVPRERLGVNLRPYLGQDEKIISDYEVDEKRTWLEREYKFLVANRPRHKELDEIYNWEKIYKIDHKTRFIDKRLKFFELGQQPHKRRLDARLPKYIPKALRPDLPKNKGRTAKEYFP